MNSMLPELTSMISRLVQEPSVSCVNPLFDMSNRPVCEILADWLATVGCAVELVELPGDRDNVNLIARFGTGPVGLALCGHTDTVPYDEALWTQNPLGGDVIDDRLYGLGSADMKGFLALCAHICATLNADTLKRSVILIGSADEESSMDGARHLCSSNFQMPPFCIVGEPTGMQPIRQHKGTLMERITLTGRSGHSSDPKLGINAIDGMHEVIGHLKQFRLELQTQYRDESFTVPTPTLNFGHIRGGDNPNRICGSCALDFDLRLMPGMTVADTRARLHEFVRQKMTDTPLTLEFSTLFKGANPLSTSRHSPLLHACENHSGRSSGSVSFCTEGPFYQALGADTMILGPGDIAVAHQPDEFLPLSNLAPMQTLIGKLIHEFCIAV
ncbi:MAG: acetylornithine deacetylase [Gammaproteobacteria bacterium]|nr:acetylornithine deacetylase [Gammaproteobacteria bacterium]